MVKRFAPEFLQGLDVRVETRGCLPLGGGVVVFTCPVVKHQLVPVRMDDVGRVKRIGGVAFAARYLYREEPSN